MYKDAARRKFFSRIDRDREDGCHLWTGGLNGRGYGYFLYDGKPQGTHRLAWKFEHGEIPDGLWVLHKFDVRHCVNPDHLFLGTLLDNNADRHNKGHTPKGERHAASKLTEEKVLRARALWHTGECTVRELARMFEVSGHTIYFAVIGQTWKHVGGLA